jgi:hypothetical protein
MKDAVSVVKQYDYNGKLIREIQLPAVGTAGGFGGKKKKRKCCILLLITQRQERFTLLNLKQENQGLCTAKSGL